MVRRVGDMDKRQAELVLGLTGTYDARKLRQAYARQAMRWHPDRQEGAAARERAERRMIEVNVAYARLKGLFSDGTTTVATEGMKWARTAKSVSAGPGVPGNGRTSTVQRPAESASARTHAAPRSQPPPPPTPPPPPPGPRPPRAGRRELHPGSPPPPPPWPRGHGVAYRLVERFPWRTALLVVVALLFISPEHAGMDYIANFGRFHFVTLYQGGFIDFLLWQVAIVPLAVYNLFTGAITDPLLKRPLLRLAERGERRGP